MKFRIATILAALIPLYAFGQASNDLRPAAYAIRDARVVVEPGVVIPKATIGSFGTASRHVAVGPNA